MTNIDIITLSAFPSSDGGILTTGATVKFDSEFLAASTDIKITLRFYRNREVFEGGYDSVPMPQTLFPYDFNISVTKEEFYVITPTILYQLVCDYLNTLVPDTFEVQITP